MWSLYVTKTRFKYGHQYDVDEKETGLNYKLTLQQYLTPTKKKNLFLYTQHLLGNVYVTLVFDLRLRKCFEILSQTISFDYDRKFSVVFNIDRRRCTHQGLNKTQSGKVSLVSVQRFSCTIRENYIHKRTLRSTWKKKVR